MNLQPFLEDDRVRLEPLHEADFREVYAAASDPQVWEQHPNKDRYKEDVFRNFFHGALKSGGASKVIEKATGKIVGCTRFYDYDANKHSIFIGYTFYAREFWGKGLNASAKKLMLDYIFDFVGAVYFHIGAENYRSQKAMAKLPARKTGELNIAYFGEPERHNYEYEIMKSDWEKSKK
ncbi:MAG: N-acetyltransferase [Chryseobacterium sp.]|nr:MAG: N-acetyltransferase [Chryseobacterium sp.]